MMGGVGARLGASVPKQFIKIKNKPIFAHILERLSKVRCIDDIVIVVHKDWIDYTKKYCKDNNIKKVYDVIGGGNTRSESVLNGLRKAKEFASDNDIIMMFDTTHPYVDKKGTEELTPPPLLNNFQNSLCRVDQIRDEQQRYKGNCLLS